MEISRQLKREEDAKKLREKLRRLNRSPDL